MSIRVENLTKTYGSQVALNAINFDIKKGEIVGFLGPNGAGKTTTMKIISGFLQPNEGTVYINDINVLTHSLETKKLIGYLPEHNPLYTEMYIKEFLSFMGNLTGNGSKNKVDEVIKLVGLEREQSKKISELSKGYRQRVGLAHALIHDPEVIILDEPTTGLDPNQLEEIRNLIKELGKNKTVILSTHIMQEVMAICSRVIIINKGNLVFNKEVATITEPLEDLFKKLTQ